MWWVGPWAGCSCRLSDVALTSPWVLLRPLDASSPSNGLPPVPVPSPGLYMARHRDTQELVALKVLDRRVLRQRAKRRRLRQEVKVLQVGRDHPHLLQLYEVKAVGARVELAFELARGGEVMATVQSEKDVSRAIQQVANGLWFLHSKGIVHGGVRPEHVLLSDPEPDARVLLAAFGRAAPWRLLTLRRRPWTSGFLWDDCLHIRFLPPFLLVRKNRCKQQGDGRHLVKNWSEAQQLDVWALGVTLYVMLCSTFPFTSDKEQEKSVVEIERSILQDKLTFAEDGRLLSRAARDLLQRLLEKDPETAMSMNDVVAHPWLTEGVASAVSWNAEKLARHNLFTARYAEEVAAVTSRSSRTNSSASSGLHNKVANIHGTPGRNVKEPCSSEKEVPNIDAFEEEGDEEDARSSLVSTHGTQVFVDEEAQRDLPSADCSMRLANLAMDGNSMDPKSEDENVAADFGTGSLQGTIESRMLAAHDREDRPLTREKSLYKIKQVLLRQRRFFSFKSMSSSSSNDRS